MSRMKSGTRRKCSTCCSDGQQYNYHPSKEIFHHLFKRQYSGTCTNAQKIVNDYVSHQAPGLMKEKEYDLGSNNKVFASKWLDDKQVVFGTKCNKLMVMDVYTGRNIQIPSLKSSDESTPADCPCGIHAIALNPSESLLATGGENTNDLAIYMLPTFDPVMVGECSHSDWIFDIEWVDDEYVLTGSRDSQLALWKVDNLEKNESTESTSLQFPEYTIKKPEVVKLCDKAQKVRALCFDYNRKELGVLSLNAYFHIWDVESFSPVSSRKLFHSRENVCMAVSIDKTMYAVGSQSHINLVDPRSPNTLTTVISKYRGGGVRSLSFKGDILTIGTGVGHVLFFDVKGGKYIETECGDVCSLKVAKGWLLHDENYREFFMEHLYPNAIYTHQYDHTGTRLFTAGGPLPAGLWGNYAGLWY
ncbi:DDB1- and CUL4-associated factor 12-like [Mytilus californianus]|uniref:DDB1- and CUL4-associated factor 12-like n=1 Tax=Mytilus californianus TaxID=6549 RepID=UPI00224783D1|nr:DDB1- and CUL4-associated factor 12-like [Mytilus californianus]